MYRFKQAWRWYGPDDPVSLGEVKQAGASELVHALHYIPNGSIWPLDEIKARQKLIAEGGLRWSVVESLPVHEDVKLRQGRFKEYIEHYKTSIRNLAEAGIHTITYNFMPVLDWTRTDLAFSLPSGAKALRFDKKAYHAFLLFLLGMEDRSITEQERLDACKYFYRLSPEEKERLTQNILAGLPGSEEKWELADFRVQLKAYENTPAEKLRQNLVAFLEEVTPVAEACGSVLCLHPDDPPFSLFGLPRVVSSLTDYRYLFEEVPSKANGMCFCSGSLGARADNHLPEILEAFGSRIHFVHLRSVHLETDGSFYEANHLEGSSSMAQLVKALIGLMQKRQIALPMRPDHGHQMLDDLQKKTNPGYSAIGRLKGLAELRGLEYGLSSEV